MFILQSFVFIILVKSLSVKYNPNSIKLGIDYGPRLIGIAVSDRLGRVHPLLTIPNTRNLTEVSLEIVNIIQTKGKTCASVSSTFLNVSACLLILSI